jgi:hypothetical protein
MIESIIKIYEKNELKPKYRGDARFGEEIEGSSFLVMEDNGKPYWESADKSEISFCVYSGGGIIYSELTLEGFEKAKEIAKETPEYSELVKKLNDELLQEPTQKGKESSDGC